MFTGMDFGGVAQLLRHRVLLDLRKAQRELMHLERELDTPSDTPPVCDTAPSGFPSF
jgi:hypothetical protein